MRFLNKFKAFLAEGRGWTEGRPWTSDAAKGLAVLALLGLLSYIVWLVLRVPSTEVGRFVAVVQVLTLAALVWYAWETRTMRSVSATQMRLTVMPIVRVEFHKAPDKIFIENIGFGIASKALLQGFRYRDRENILRCDFEEVHSIQPGKSAAPYIDIELEQLGSERLDPSRSISVGGREIFHAIGRALEAREPLLLRLYFMDVLGHCYRSDLRISFLQFGGFVATGDEQPETFNPVQCYSFPKSIKPVNAV